MAKRTADETTEPVTGPQAKRPCHRAVAWTPQEQQRPFDTDKTCLAKLEETDVFEVALDEEHGLVIRLQTIQAALLRHLDQKCKHLQFIAPRSTYAVESQLAKVTDTMKLLNHEIAAMGRIISQMESHSSLPLDGLTPCRAGNPTYFAPHQYVPIPRK